MADKNRNRRNGFKNLVADATLWSAWGKVASGSGMPGVDGTTVERFANDAASHIRSIQQDLRAGEYRFAPLREFHRKTGGRQRTFSMPTLRDRVVHRAILDVAGRQIHGGQHSSSFAYRKGRSWLDALKAVEKARDGGQTWVYRGDIASFFDSIDHGILRTQISIQLEDERLALLVSDLIGTPSVTTTGFSERSRGLPLGLALSGALANLHLKGLDHRASRSGTTFVRYADDMISLTRTQEDAELSRSAIEGGLRQLDLALQPSKSYVSNFDRGFGYLGWIFFKDSGFPERENAAWTHPMSFH